MKKTLISLLFVAFSIGQCIEINHGVFKGTFWRIFECNQSGSEFGIRDGIWVIREVQISFLSPAKDDQCTVKK